MDVVDTVLEHLHIRPPRRSNRLAVKTPRLVNTQLIGSFRSMVKGRGIEFEGYKHYVAGQDDSKYIDWKASVRAGEILVKEFKEERDITIMFMLDGGSNMAFASKDKLKLEYAIELITSLAYNSIATGDRIGLLIFTDKTKKYLPPTTGRVQYHKLMDVLTDVKNYGGPTDMTEALKHLNQTLHRNAVLFIISDFIYMPETIKTTMSMAGLKFDVICLMVHDPRDLEMPMDNPGNVLIKSPMTGETLMFNPHDIREAYAAVAKQEFDEAETILSKTKASVLRLRTDEDFLPKLVNFFSNRTTKWK